MAAATHQLNEFTPEFESPQLRRASWFPLEEGWRTFLLVLLLIFAVVWSVETAGWVKDLPSLTFIAAIGAFVGLLLAKRRRNPFLLHLLGLASGFLVLIWQTGQLTRSGNFIEKADDLFHRFWVWVSAAESGGISADPLPFVTILIILTWLLSYTASWMVFRSLRLWPVILLLGLALFLNLLYLPSKFAFFFYLYVFIALLLAMRLHFLKKRRQWEQEEIPYVRKVGSAFFTTALVIGAVVVLVAWSIPKVDFSVGMMKDAWGLLSTPWKSMETELGRVLPFLPAQKPYTIYRFGSAFPFRGTSSLGEHVVMEIASTRPAYWRAQTYDVYTHEGWVTGERAKLERALRPDEVESYLAIRQVNQEVTMGVDSDVILTGGIPLYATEPFEVEIAPPSSHVIEIDPTLQSDELPGDLEEFALALREEASKGGLSFSGGGAVSLLPSETEIKEIVRKDNRVVRVEVAREISDPPDITSFRPTGELRTKETYQALSYVSVASEEQLRRAGTDYPKWVTDRYLQLPGDMPERIARFSEAITRPYDNPYDKATAIESYLRRIALYSTNIDPPPKGRDGVEYFLFESRKGYSTYFSSSMAVMLRSIGIPARLAAGYSTGSWDEDLQRYVVRSASAHSWPEVYFPDYGWIPFEPVYIYDVFLRGGPTDEEGLRAMEQGGPTQQAGDPPGLGQEVPGKPDAGIFQSVSKWGTLVLLAIPFIILVGTVGFGVYWFHHGLGGLDLSAKLYAKMTRLATLGKFVPRRGQTPIEYAYALATEMDAIEGHIERIAEVYVQWRYSRAELSPEVEKELWDRWRLLRRTLLWWALKRRILSWRRRHEVQRI